MTIKIGSNIASIQAQRRLGEATSSLGKIYERLSSGQRINTASDDVAGLAIANDLNTKNRVFTQAIRNGNDGISALNIADSALDNLSSVVIRIRELAEQSANGTYSNKQRAAIDKEAQALKAEYFRISKTTTFNGVKLFDGSLGSGLTLQLGFGVEGSIKTSIGGATGTGTIGAATSYSAESTGSHDATLGDINGDGVLDLITAGIGPGGGYASIRIGNGNGTFGSSTSYTADGISSNAITLGDLNGDGILDLVTAGYSSGIVGSATIRLGSGNGSFGASSSFTTELNSSNDVTLGDINNDGNLDLITAGSGAGQGRATIRLGTGNGSFGSATSFITEVGYATNSVALNDLNGDGNLDLISAGSDGFNGYATIRLGDGNGSFGTATSYSSDEYNSQDLILGDLNGDGILDLITSGSFYDSANSSYNSSATVRLGTGNGSFGTATSYSALGLLSGDANSVTLGDLNGDGILDLITAGYGDGSGYAAIRLGNGNGTFGALNSYITELGSSKSVVLGDLNGDGVLDLTTAGTGGGGRASVRLGVSRDGLSPLQNFSLKTKADSLQAIGLFQIAQDNLAKQRGVIGAYQSRLNIALNNLSSSKENFSAAESRIRDADIAAEAANLIRTQILQQAATSVLAQANQAPALALALLRS